MDDAEISIRPGSSTNRLQVPTRLAEAATVSPVSSTKADLQIIGAGGTLGSIRLYNFVAGKFQRFINAELASRHQ